MSSSGAARNFSVKELLSAAVAQLEERYRKENPKSLAQFENACRWLPAGSTRATVFYAPFPLTIRKGEGAYVEDLDGHRYRNFVGEFTAGLYGHDPVLLNKILSELGRTGMMLSGPSEYEAKLAEVICSRFKSCEKVRFCNSGTEANLLALGLARNATERDAVLVFKGAYHGGFLTFGDPDGALNVPLRTVKATYNDIEGTRELIRKNREILGAVIIEPMMGAGGCIPASKAFLQMLREETAKSDIVLIFDEVMTSRLSPSGLQGVHGIKPDLTSFGKYMGGGFSFGAVGGAERIMSLLDARVEGALPHPGTFNNNVASMIGGYFALSQHYTPEQNIALNEKGDRLRARLNLLAKEHDADLQFSGLGAVMAAQFVRKPISNPADAENQNAALLRKLLHLGMLSKGVYIAHRCLVTLNMMMTEADLDAFCESFAEFLKENRELLSAEV